MRGRPGRQRLGHGADGVTRLGGTLWPDAVAGMAHLFSSAAGVEGKAFRLDHAGGLERFGRLVELLVLAEHVAVVGRRSLYIDYRIRSFIVLVLIGFLLVLLAAIICGAAEILDEHLLEVALLALVLLHQRVVLASGTLHCGRVESARPQSLHVHVVLLVVVGDKSGCDGGPPCRKGEHAWRHPGRSRLLLLLYLFLLLCFLALVLEQVGHEVEIGGFTQEAMASMVEDLHLSGRRLRIFRLRRLLFALICDGRGCDGHWHYEKLLVLFLTRRGIDPLPILGLGWHRATAAL